MIAVALNQEFKEPFGIPEGFVRANMTDRNTLKIFIGPRDIEIDENGKVVGAGTALECWKIEARHQ